MQPWLWIVSGLAGVALGVVQVKLLKKAAALGDQKTVALSMIAKMLLWGAAIAGGLLVDVRALIGIFAGAAPVYTGAVVHFWRHRGD